MCIYIYILLCKPIYIYIYTQITVTIHYYTHVYLSLFITVCYYTLLHIIVYYLIIINYNLSLSDITGITIFMIFKSILCDFH